MGKLISKRWKEFKKEDIWKLRIWWEFAYENKEVEIYNKCEEYFDKEFREYLDVKRCWKSKEKWEDLGVKDLVYLPCVENLLGEEDGIIRNYYRKGDIIRICGGSKLIGKKVFDRLEGEKVEDCYKDLVEIYYEYYIKGEGVVDKSLLSKSIYRVLDEKKKEEVDKVMEERGLRFDKVRNRFVKVRKKNEKEEEEK